MHVPFLQSQKLWCEALNMEMVLLDRALYNWTTQEVNTRQDIGSIWTHILHQEVC